jgi:hypothetical protein
VRKSPNGLTSSARPASSSAAIGRRRKPGSRASKLRRWLVTGYPGVPGNEAENRLSAGLDTGTVPVMGWRRSIGYAWRESYRHASTWWVAAIGGIFGGLVVLTGFQMPFPAFIFENPYFAGAANAVACAMIGVLIVFLARLAYAPLHFALEPQGGLKTAIRNRLGMQMWPAILMLSGFAAFVFLFGAGAILFVVQSSKQPQISSSTSSAISLSGHSTPYNVEVHLRAIDDFLENINVEWRSVERTGGLFSDKIKERVLEGRSDDLLKDYVAGTKSVVDKMHEYLRRYEALRDVHDAVAVGENNYGPEAVYSASMNLRAEIVRLQSRTTMKPDDVWAYLERHQFMVDWQIAIANLDGWINAKAARLITMRREYENAPIYVQK